MIYLSIFQNRFFDKSHENELVVRELLGMQMLYLTWTAVRRS